MELYTQYFYHPVVATTFATSFGLIASAALCVLLLIPPVGLTVRKDGSKIPPGPRGWPVIGMFPICLPHA